MPPNIRFLVLILLLIWSLLFLLLLLLLLPDLRLYKADFKHCLYIWLVLKLKRLRRRRRLNKWQRFKGRLIRGRFQLSRRLKGPFGSTSATLLWIVIAMQRL